MKTSLSHLPEQKQQEILRIAEIIREVVHPEMIILFGSYAKGTYVEDRYRGKDGITYEYISDYDFLVVTKNNQEKTYSQESKIMDRIDRYRPPVNLEIHEIEYINLGLEMGEYFFVDIVREGIVLQDSTEVRFASPRELTQKEKKEKAVRYMETWLPQAGEFIEGCRFYLSRGNLKTGVFLLHQAAESLYYTTLLIFSGYKPKTHNLWKLRRKTKPYSPELFSIFKTETDKTEEHLFELLKGGYVDARYKSDYQITENELVLLLERVTSMMIVVSQLSKSEIDKL